MYICEGGTPQNNPHEEIPLLGPCVTEWHQAFTAALFLCLIGEVTGVCCQEKSDGLPWGRTAWDIFPELARSMKLYLYLQRAPNLLEEVPTDLSEPRFPFTTPYHSFSGRPPVTDLECWESSGARTWREEAVGNEPLHICAYKHAGGRMWSMYWVVVVFEGGVLILGP